MKENEAELILWVFVASLIYVFLQQHLTEILIAIVIAVTVRIAIQIKINK